MSEANREVIKPEMMKAYIWLQTTDGAIEQVEREVAILCPTIRRAIHTGMGSSEENPISLPPQVNAAMLTLIVDYCRFQVSVHSDEELESFNKTFIQMDRFILDDLAIAAESLQLMSLIELAVEGIVQSFQELTPEEISNTFALPNDLTEIDEAISSTLKMFEDKNVKLRKKQLAKVEEKPVDDRSIDDLLSFINGGNGDSTMGKDQQSDTCSTSAASLTDFSSSNKKSKRGKDQKSNTCSTSAASLTEIHEDSNEPDSVGHTVQMPNLIQPNIDPENSNEPDAPDDEFEDGYPESNRVVAEFARKLNLDWDAMQEDLRHVRRPVLTSSNGKSDSSHTVQMPNLIQPNIDPENSNEPDAPDDEFEDGDPESNRVVAEFARKLNLDWDAMQEDLRHDSNEPDSEGHTVQMPNLIQPNIDPENSNEPDAPDDEFEDGDPESNRVVAEFARKLNLDWDAMQEDLRHVRRPVLTSSNGKSDSRDKNHKPK